MKSLVKIIAKILFFFFVVSFNLLAQQRDTTINITKKTVLQDSVARDTVAFKMQKSPWGAVLRGAIIPGWGQIYTKSYWKAPIVWGLIGFYAYYWKVNNDKYIEWRNTHLANPNDEQSKLNRDSYRDQRDLVALYMGLTYFLSLVDAYVDAQMFDFTVDENPRTQSLQLNMKIHF